MIQVKTTRKKGDQMAYNIKDAVTRIDTYAQRHLKSKPMTEHDKQMVAGHILPLISGMKPKEAGRVQREEIVDQQDPENSTLKPESE